MIKMEKILLFMTLLILLVGVASAAESVQEDNTHASDETVLSDTSTVSPDNKETINIEEDNVLDENPTKNTDESKIHTIEKKITDTNTKKEGTAIVKNYTELRAAVLFAFYYGFDTVQLQEGIYDNNETIEWNTPNLVLTIDGNGQTINGHGKRVFTLSPGTTLILKNITITNATVDGDGGAIYNNNGNLTVTNSTFQNNHADHGGAIYNYFGDLTVSGSTFQNNTAIYGEGGAIRNFYATMTVTGSTFQNNIASLGGAIVDTCSDATVSDSLFTNNTGSAYGGSINNYDGNLTVTGSRFQYNYGGNAGAIENSDGNLTVTESIFLNNTSRWWGGAIYDDSVDILSNISSSNFTYNTASNGAAIYAYGWINLTGNTFNENTATENKQTIDLNGYDNGEFEDNVYESTDISLSEIKLSVKDGGFTYSNGVDAELNFTIRPTNVNYYKDFEEGIRDITVYVNGEKNVTTRYENYTLTGLKPGEYEVYFTSCNQQSNTLTFFPNSQITTPETIYEYYAGINDKIPLIITNAGEKGTITLKVKEGNEYKQLSTYYNVGEKYTLFTEALAELLENVYDELDSSYIINVTYDIDDSYVSPCSTEFTLNINKQRNTTIVYDIINNTEGNVQINITVQDAIYKTPINDAHIQITGDFTQSTTAGIITDNTLTPGEYRINVKYEETDDYKESNTTINFKVEIDKDKIIEELEEKINNLTEQLTEADKQINELNSTVNNLTEQLTEANNEIGSLNNNITNLTEQLTEANNKINTLNEELEQANKEIETLNNIIKELTKPPLNTTITINPIKSSIGSITNITAKITDENGNRVTGGKAVFKVNGITLKDEYNNVIYAHVNDGIASINYKVQDVWIKDTSYVEAVYGGTANYSEARTKATDVLDISPGISTITLEKQTVTAKSGQTVTLRAKIVDATGDNINKGKVVFKLNGKTLKDENGEVLYAQVKNGEAVLDYTIPSIYSAKSYTLTAVFGGGNYQRAETTGNLILEKQAVTISTDTITTTKGKTTIKGKITDETGKLLVTSTKLAIKINQKTILNNATSINGTMDVSFNTTLRPGTYELTIISGENSIYKKGTLSTVLKI
ncbi:MAG: hypothetical protein VZR33_06100 [Methanosphaera sp.]|uniref:hypothetical protein n=1 Tax=Methanosphaera sp. TaxID=2666342 RepID=UPI002E759C56|nr:hypothetical protein [Methanosphaera sp.]MEE1117270.1 hypothetical protein [Methanosphaera sp.]MEE3324891.1 hypothetical protein [Methanosphaera sp.]MEE3418556.1 hypothetical protein [Methanosphaera sp.]